MADYRIKNFHSNKQYSEGAVYCSNAAVREHFNEWDYLYYVNCLYKLQQYTECLEVCKECRKKFPKTNLINDKEGWSIYQRYLKTFDYERGDKKMFLRQVDYIIARCEDKQYSPRNTVIKLTIDAVFKKKFAVNPDYKLGNKYLSLLDPMQLSDEEQEIEKDGRVIKTLSERERWFTRKTKALLKLEQYDECLDYIEKAFQVIKKFHNNGNHWMNYRRACCYAKLGDLETASKLTQQILKAFKHWCFYELLFHIYIAQKYQTKEDILKNGCLCATADHEHKLRVTFYENFAQYLLLKKMDYEAALHYKLIELIREEEGWKQISLPSDFIYPEVVMRMDKKTVLKELSSFWKSNAEFGKDFHEGAVYKIFRSGNEGRILDDDGKEYYFHSRSFVKKGSQFQVGTRVRYTLEEGYDKKNQCFNMKAVEIQLI